MVPFNRTPFILNFSKYAGKVDLFSYTLYLKNN